MIRITTIIVLLGLLFGSSGAAVVFAQNSLPGEALYSIKTTSEDIQMVFIFNQEERLAKALELINARYIEAIIKGREGTEWTDHAVRDFTEQLDQNLTDALDAISDMNEPSEGLVLLAETIGDLTCTTDGRLLRPRDRAKDPEDDEPTECPGHYQLQKEKLSEDPSETLDIAAIFITLYEQNVAQYPELLVASQGNSGRIDMPAEGNKSLEPSGNPDLDQSFGDQDPQAQYGDEFAPAYGEAPSESPRDPYAIKNNGTQNYGPGPGGSESTGDPSQNEDDKGSEQKELDGN